MEQTTFDIFDNQGLRVASVQSADRDAALRDMWHYARQYVQDSPIVVKENGKKFMEMKQDETTI